MAILNENEKQKLVNLGHLEVYTQEVKDYITNHLGATNDSLVAVDQRIWVEASTRAEEDLKLTKSITDEISRATDKEQEIAALVVSENARAVQEEIAIRSELSSAINEEIEDRNAAIYQAELRVGEKITTSLTSIESKINTSVSNLTNEINAEIANRTIVTTALSQQVTNETSERENADNALRKSIDEHILNRATLTSHIENKNNPHNITAELIGAATLGNLNILENKVDVNNSSALKNFGDLKLVGNLVIGKDGENNNGHLTVEGDLIVNGATITTTRETQLVEDNFLLLNSNDNRLAAPAGIAVRLGDNTAAAIAYNPATNNFSLGQGTININNDFTFDQNASKHILTTKSELEDKHLLIWDSATGTVIDGGTYDETKLKNLFVSWEAHNSLIIDIDRNSNSIDSLQDIKQNKEDVDLSTSNKTIVGAINELQFNHQDHVNKLNNPHSVTWSQIIKQESPFTIETPKMAGSTATAGSSNFVARYDHVHPTDTSRAPTSHTFIDSGVDYGKATAAVYGHVRYSSDVKNDTAGVVSAQQLTDYVSEQINNLSKPLTNIEANKAISKISQNNGLIEVETLEILIDLAQVTDLPARLSTIENTINVDNESSLKEIINTLRENLSDTGERLSTVEQATDTLQTSLDNVTKSLTTEISERIQADTAAAVLADARLASATSDLQSQIDSLLGFLDEGDLD